MSHTLSPAERRAQFCSNGDHRFNKSFQWHTVRLNPGEPPLRIETQGSHCMDCGLWRWRKATNSNAKTPMGAWKTIMGAKRWDVTPWNEYIRLHCSEEYIAFLRTLSTRAGNCLIAESIFSFEQLVLTSEQDLLRVPNMGKKSVAEVVAGLSLLNMTLQANEISSQLSQPHRA